MIQFPRSCDTFAVHFADGDRSKEHVAVFAFLRHMWRIGRMLRRDLAFLAAAIQLRPVAHPRDRRVDEGLIEVRLARQDSRSVR